MKNYLKNYSIKNIRLTINKYGFKYSNADFMISSLLLITAILFISCISHLHLRYILILVLLTMGLTPFLIISFFKQSYNISRFNMLTDYLENIIPIFSQKAKIRYTLGELYDILSSSIKESIRKAINYLDNTVNDPDISKNALSLIENDFPNSRVRSVHKLLLSIESTNSISYGEVCQNMYEDIEGWIKRVYAFQKDLKNRRIKLQMLCLITVLMNALFSYLYVNNDYFTGFVDSWIYQISTFLFIGAILILLTLISTRLHGSWLIEDIRKDNEVYLFKKYSIYKNKDIKPTIFEIIIALILLIFSTYFYLKGNRFFVLLPLMAVLILGNKKRKYKKAFRIISKELTLEFPLWLREISLSLNNLTVINAINNSLGMASYPMRQEIQLFLDNYNQDPSSIRPYNEFLKDFSMDDALSSMKVLYAIQNIGKENVKERISNLVLRNQELLDKAETIRNNDSISGIEALGYAPIVIFSIQMIVMMFAMFSYMMNTLQSSINL